MARRLHTFAFLAAGLSLAGPVLAETAHTSLSVGATVVPACVATSSPEGTASFSCSHLADGQVEIRRSDLPSTASSRDASPPPASRVEARGDGIAYVTITY